MALSNEGTSGSAELLREAMEAAMEGGQGALADILNQAKRNSLELERRRSTEIKRIPSSEGRRSMEAGRASVEARRASGEARTSTQIVRAPKGEPRGKCPKGHPMFQRAGGTGTPTCSQCFKRVGFDCYCCELCNFFKCDDCLIGYERRKKKLEEAEKDDDASERGKSASCFCCFGGKAGSVPESQLKQPQKDSTSSVDV